MDKSIVVIYIGIKKFESIQKIQQYLSKAVNDIPQNNDIHHYFVPTKEHDEIKIDCINPKLISKEEFEEIRSKLDFLKDKIEEALIL